MLSKIIAPEFNVAHAHIRHTQLSADIPDGLAINRTFLKWTENWDNIFRVSPRSFYDTARRNIDGFLKVYVDLDTGGEGSIDLSISAQGRSVFEIHNELHHDYRGFVLAFKSWENKDIDSRGSGTGLNLFKNIFTIAEQGHIDLILLRAGKEDGRHFWARHGFYFADEFCAQRVTPEIRRNIENYSNTIPVGIQKTAHEILDQGGADMCWKIARLEGQVQVGEKMKPLGWALLRTDSESNYMLDMHDPEQVARVKASFTKVPASAPEFASTSGFAPL